MINELVILYISSRIVIRNKSFSVTLLITAIINGTLLDDKF